jgi:hypothetical protein
MVLMLKMLLISMNIAMQMTGKIVQANLN